MDDIVRWVGLLTGLAPVDLITCVINPFLSEPFMAHKAYIVHAIPGRVRLRVPEKRGDLEFFEDVRRRLRDCPSIQAIDINPNTAGILLHYQGGDPTVLFIEAANVGLTELAEIRSGLPPLEPINRRLMNRLREVDGRIAHATKGTTDGAAVAVLGLLLAGGLQVIRGEVLGSAIPLLWYAWQAVSGPPTPRGIS